MWRNERGGVVHFGGLRLLVQVILPRPGRRFIIYCEVIATIAIFLGLGAINLARARVGVEVPASPATARVVGLSALAALVFAGLAFA